MSTHRGCRSPEALAGHGPSPEARGHGPSLWGARTSCTAWRSDCSPSRICNTCSDSSITACRSLSSVSVFLASLGPWGTVSRPLSGPGEGLLLHSGPDWPMRKENLGWSEPQPSSMPSTTLGLRSGGTFHGMGGSRSPSRARGGAEGPASAFKAPALPGLPLPPRRGRGAVRRGDSSLAAEDEEVQPGDSRGLEGSSAGAGETVGPCSPSVSFSSSVDIRVLSPLRELVSTSAEPPPAPRL